MYQITPSHLPAAMFPRIQASARMKTSEVTRAVGIDLQKEVHEDMARDFGVYPPKWELHPDANIDHRRVPNLMTFFSPNGRSLDTNATTDRIPKICYPPCFA